MLRTTARRISAACVIAALFTLSVQPAAALSRPETPAAHSVAPLLLWLSGLWGNGGAPAKRPAGHRLSALIGKLGGFLDPDGAKLTTTSTTTSTTADSTP